MKFVHESGFLKWFHIGNTCLTKVEYLGKGKLLRYLVRTRLDQNWENGISRVKMNRVLPLIILFLLFCKKSQNSKISQIWKTAGISQNQVMFKHELFLINFETILTIFEIFFSPKIVKKTFLVLDKTVFFIESVSVISVSRKLTPCSWVSIFNFCFCWDWTKLRSWDKYV